MELASIFLIISIIFFFTGIGMIVAVIIKGEDDAGIPLQDGWDNPFFSRFPSRKK